MMVKRKLDGAMDKSLADQEICKSAVKNLIFHIACKKSKGVHQAESGLTAGRQAVRHPKFG